jgi:DMSO/TMAO reductase YedYZ molybdopterin-dependent catalytic subunit
VKAIRALASLAALAVLAVGAWSQAELPGVEVRSYEGKKLDSVNAFRENSIRGPQKIDLASYRLAIKGLVGKPLSLSYEQVLAHPAYKKVVTLYCVEGWAATVLFEGVLVADLLEQAGLDPQATVVIFRAHDGYSSSLPLRYIRENKILLGYRMNEIPLPVDRGYPFQLVAEEKWGYKWIRWVTEIEASRDEKFRGYWENRGYSQKGDLKSPSFGTP